MKRFRPILTCQRCGHEWVRRGIGNDPEDLPGNCANKKCNSPYWDKPRRETASADERWLREKAAAEDGCLVSVGGLVTDLEAMATHSPTCASRHGYACNCG